MLCDATPATIPTILAPVTNEPNAVASTISNSLNIKITRNNERTHEFYYKIDDKLLYIYANIGGE